MRSPAPTGTRLLITVLTTAGIPSAAVPPDPAPALPVSRTVALSTVRVLAAASQPEATVASWPAARLPCWPAAAVQSSWLHQRAHLAAAVLSADSPIAVLWHAVRAPAATAVTAAVSPLVLSCLLPPAAGLRLHPR